MSEFEILTEFKNGLITFFDELIDVFPTEGDLIMARIFLKDQIPITDVITLFINNLNKDDQMFKKMIKNRNESFFINK